MTAEKRGEKTYFAASNSARGFVNYFPDIFGTERCDVLFVIKGGPGTGKSSFLRRVAEHAEANGLSVIRYLCSSDPTSLDGIYIAERRMGFLDGTAPHAWEPTAIGTFEQLIDLGAFWDRNALRQKREDIERYAEEKKACYRRAYGYLAAYGSVCEAMTSEMIGAVDQEKLYRACERVLERYGEGRDVCAKTEIGLCDSFGMNGRKRLDTYERATNSHVLVRDEAGIAHLFFAKLLSLCRARGLSVRVSYHPILSDRIDALELIGNGVSFSIAEGGEEDDVFNMRRFLKRDAYRNVRGGIKTAKGICESILTCAEAQMSLARTAHFALETLFGTAMDFPAKESYEQKFCANLFGG